MGLFPGQRGGEGVRRRHDFTVAQLGADAAAVGGGRGGGWAAPSQRRRGDDDTAAPAHGKRHLLRPLGLIEGMRLAQLIGAAAGAGMGGGQGDAAGGVLDVDSRGARLGVGARQQDRGATVTHATPQRIEAAGGIAGSVEGGEAYHGGGGSKPIGAVSSGTIDDQQPGRAGAGEQRAAQTRRGIRARVDHNAGGQGGDVGGVIGQASPIGMDADCVFGAGRAAAMEHRHFVALRAQRPTNGRTQKARATEKKCAHHGWDAARKLTVDR